MKLEQRNLVPELIKSPDYGGWNFDCGDPELWKFSDRLFKPQGRILDLGGQLARNSLLFAFRGMSVELLDTDPWMIENASKIAHDYQLDISTRQEDITTAKYPESAYDIIIIGEVLHHMRNKQVAYELVDRAISALKPGGHIWARTAGVNDSAFASLQNKAEHGTGDGVIITATEPGTFLVNHTHHAEGHHNHGHGYADYRTFLPEPELMFRMIANGLDMVHTDFTPAKYVPNIMYGEYWPNSSRMNSYITVLAQKLPGVDLSAENIQNSNL